MNLALDSSGYPVLERRRQPGEPPSNPFVDSAVSARRRDLVRDAAREFEDLSSQDLRERFGLGPNASEADLARLQHDVRQQVLDDLLDALDGSRRAPLRSRRTVRVVAPRGYVRRVVRGLSDDERTSLRDRLRARGWGEVDVKAVLW